MSGARFTCRKKTTAVTEGDAGGRWLLTFNDMITLILTFFVLILAMSDMDKPSIDQVSQSVSEAFGLGGIRKPLVTPRTAQPSMDMGQIRAERRADISRMAIQIASLPGMEAQEGAGGVRITVPEKTLFAPGAADLENNGLETLMRLVSVLRESGVFIFVEGHADNLPIANDRFASNWELSAARAVSVVAFLAGEGGIAPERLFAVGYGDTRPLAANDTAENRQKNRRVEINLKFQD